MDQPRREVPEWMLERFLAGDLDRKAAERVSRSVEADPALRARLEALRRENTQVLAQHPPEEVLAEVQRRARRSEPQKERRPARPLWLLAPALATAMLAVLLIHPSETADPIGEGPEITRLKGTPRLAVYRLEGEKAEPLSAGASASRGDALQLRYFAAGKRHGVVLSVDGRGGVTLHFPEEPRGSTALKLEGREVSLPHGYQLDDAPRFERFFFITSDQPLVVPELFSAAERLARSDDPETGELSTPPGTSQTSLLLRKVNP